MRRAAVFALFALTGLPWAGQAQECPPAGGLPLTLDPSRLIGPKEVHLFFRQAQYLHYLSSHSDLADALGFGEWDAETLQYFRDAVYELEASGGEFGPVSNPLPLELGRGRPDNYEDYRREVFARRVAFSLWVEMNDKVPWSLEDYTREQLEQWLSHESLRHDFVSWDYLRFSERPDLAFRELSQRFLPVENREGLVRKMIAWTGENMAHRSNREDPHPVRHVGHYFEGGAIGSCHRVGDGLCVSAAAVNIPCRTARWEHEGPMEYHRYVDFPTENLLMAHGDHAYTRGLRRRTWEGEDRRRLFRLVEQEPDRAGLIWNEIAFTESFSGYRRRESVVVDRLESNPSTRYVATPEEWTRIQERGYSAETLDLIRSRVRIEGEEPLFSSGETD